MGPSPITLTEAARKHIEDTAFAYGVERISLRVKLVGDSADKGFDLALADDPYPDERVFNHDQIRFFVAPDVLPLIRGAVVDYRWGGPRAGFVFRRSSS